MHDKHKQALHPGDRVRKADGTEFVIKGFAHADERHEQHIAFGKDVELVEKHAKNQGAKDLGAGTIIWGMDPDKDNDPI